MPETPNYVDVVLDLPVELRRSAELYALEHGIDMDTLIERALTQFFSSRE